MVGMNPLPGWTDAEEIWEKCELPYRIEAVVNYGCNSAMSMADPEAVEKNFKDDSKCY